MQQLFRGLAIPDTSDQFSIHFCNIDTIYYLEDNTRHSGVSLVGPNDSTDILVLEARRLDEEIRRFLHIYEQHGQLYGVHTSHSRVWQVVLKLWFLRQFNDAVRRLKFDEALDVFDKEAFLDLIDYGKIINTGYIELIIVTYYSRCSR